MKSSSIVASCLAGIALMSNPINGESTMTAAELEAHKNTFIQIDVRANATSKADCAVVVDPATDSMTAYQFKQATYPKANMDTAVYVSGTDGVDSQINVDYLEGLGFTNVVNLGGHVDYMQAIGNNCDRNTWKSPVCNYYHFDVRSPESVVEQGGPACAYNINGTELLTMSTQSITDEFMIETDFPIRVSCEVGMAAQAVVNHLIAMNFTNVTNNGGWGYWNNASDYNFYERFDLIEGCQNCAQRKYTPTDPENKLTGGYGYESGKGGKGGNKGGNGAKGGKGGNGAKGGKGGNMADRVNGAKGGKGGDGAKGAKGGKGEHGAKGGKGGDMYDRINGTDGADRVNGTDGADRVNGDKGGKGEKGSKGAKTGKLSAFFASDHANVAGGVLSGVVLVAGVAAFAVRRRNAKHTNYEEITPLLLNQIPDSVQIAVTV